MTNYYKCDRCGEFFSTEDPSCMILSIVHTSGGLSREYCTCPKCSKALLAFVDKQHDPDLIEFITAASSDIEPNQPAAAVSSDAPAADSDADPVLVCAKCGRPLTGLRGKDGEMHSAQEAAERMNGLCKVCYTEAKRAAARGAQEKGTEVKP